MTKSERLRGYARSNYQRVKADPTRAANMKSVRDAWWVANKDTEMEKQKLRKRQRKLEAIEYLGGVCRACKESYHPSIFEFHHKCPEDKDRDPSKMMLLSWDKLKQELDKCDLLCANCHRLEHHKWEMNGI